MQSFFVIFHKFDSDTSDTTLRYEMGYVLYMTFFFTQAVMLFGSYAFAWFVYIKLAMFLRPERRPVNDLGQEVSDDEGFED